MNLELAGKRALVTGASRGIGRAIAERLATEGCDLILVARTEADLRAAADEIAAASGRTVEFCATDLSEIIGIEAVADSLDPSPGGLDILINNAGAAKGGTIFDLQEEDWQAGFELKFYGALRLIRRLRPLLKNARALSSMSRAISVRHRLPISSSAARSMRHSRTHRRRWRRWALWTM